jgi:hypothetical protein
MTAQFYNLPVNERDRARAIYEQALELGGALLKSDLRSETARFLAFGLTKFVNNPSAAKVNTHYLRAHSEEVIEVNFGYVICEILQESDLQSTVLFTEDILSDYLNSRGLIVTKRKFNPEATVKRFARRLERLQRRVMIEPPIFAVNPDKTEIVLWNPANASLFGDIKPDIERLLEEAEELT